VVEGPRFAGVGNTSHRRSWTKERGPVTVDYEKGHTSWDISQILTRHRTNCDRVQSLRDTARKFHRDDRLKAALRTPCNCGMGDSDAEMTSPIAKEELNVLRSSRTTGHAQETGASQP
jgi:hypothetical protein